VPPHHVVLKFLCFLILHVIANLWCMHLFGAVISQGINAGDVKKLQDAGIYTCNGLMMHTKKVLNYASQLPNLCSVCLNSCCKVLKLISLFVALACLLSFIQYSEHMTIVLIYELSCRTLQESKVYLKQKLIRSARLLKNFWSDPLSWFCLLNFHAISSV